jgi:cytochrome c oxidase subunit 2
LCIALAQLFKVIELARGFRAGTDWKATESDNRMNARLMLLFYLVFMAWVVKLVMDYGYKGLPESASEHGEKVDALLWGNIIIIFIIFVFVNAALFYFAFKYYGRKDSKAVFFAHNNKLEMLWTVIPAIALAFIIIFGLKYWNEIMSRPSDKEEVIKIELYSKQFDWTARFAGVDNQFGVDDYTQIDGANSMGLDTNDSRCFDDIIVKNEIHVPVNKMIDFQFRSRDVIHSAFMPHFRAQMNCVPGQVTKFRFKPTKTTAEMRKNPSVVRNINEINVIREAKGEDKFEFDYVLLCNKICGASHFNMQMKIIVESEAEYKEWLSKQKPFKSVAEKK